MGKIVIAAYRPKPGRQEALKSLMRSHLTVLRSEQLVTDRESIMMEAHNGTLLEVFEWCSAAAIAAAHENPVVLEMWGRYAEVCDYLPLAELPEARDMFSSFTPFS